MQTMPLSTADLAGLAITDCAATACGTPRAADRQSARDALAPYVEGLADMEGQYDAASTYDMLVPWSALCQSVTCSHLNLNLED